MRVTDEQVHESFERWARPQGLRLYRRDMAGSERLGQYCSDDTQLAFEAFRAALSHAAGQDGEQCRAASLSTDNGFIGEAMGRLADEVEKPGSTVTITKADACAIGLYVRALSRGVLEGE